MRESSVIKAKCFPILGNRVPLELSQEVSRFYRYLTALTNDILANMAKLYGITHTLKATSFCGFTIIIIRSQAIAVVPISRWSIGRIELFRPFCRIWNDVGVLINAKLHLYDISVLHICIHSYTHRQTLYIILKDF